MSITSSLSSDNKVLSISLGVRFDISSHRDFGISYKDKINDVDKIIIDMSSVKYMDSSALGMLLVLRERSGEDESSINIINISDDIKKILLTANFQKLFDINRP